MDDDGKTWACVGAAWVVIGVGLYVFFVVMRG